MAIFQLLSTIITRSYTHGFNLIGNPYPSPIDWDMLLDGLKQISTMPFISIKASTTDQYGGTYRSYINGISSDGIVNNIIPSMQGFFIHVSNGSYPVTGSLSMTNAVRTTDAGHAFTKSGNINNLQFLRLGTVFSDDSASVDPLVIYFDEKATREFDRELDALKLFNTDLGIPNLYASAADGNRLSINALPVMTEDSCTIPLGLKLNRSGNIRFRISDYDYSLKGLKIYLTDIVTGIDKDLIQDNEYGVYLDKGEYNGRFFLNIKTIATGISDLPAEDDKFSIYSSQGILKATIGIVNGSFGTLRVYSLPGQMMFIGKVYSTGYHEFNTDLRNGIYIVTYSTGTYNCTRKLFIENR